MPILEVSRAWSLSSTGTAKAVNCRYAERLTCTYETSSGCTATIALQHRQGSSAGPYSVLSSQALSTGAVTTDQFSGPLEWIRPRVTDMTAGSTHLITVRVEGN